MRATIAAIPVLMCFMAQLASAATTSRPNILLLMAEDMSGRVGAFGDEVAVYSFARSVGSGRRAVPEYLHRSGCMRTRSRAAHITGMHQISFGGQHMRTSSGPLGSYKAVPPPEVKAYPELLRGAGYYTWTGSKLDYQFSQPLAGSGPFTIWDDEGGDAHLAQPAARPAFLRAGKFQYYPRKRRVHSAGELASQFPALWRCRRCVLTPCPLLRRMSLCGPGRCWCRPIIRIRPLCALTWRRHYNNIAVMDRQVGEVLAELEADGLADSTIVIWTTDHGDGLPRAKRDLFDAGIKVPMIIRWPEAYRPEGVAANGIDTRMVSFIDLAPTLLRLAGVEVPSYIQGRDFIEAEPREFIFASRDRIDEVDDRQRAVRGERYKYIRSWHPDQPGGHHLAYRDNMEMMIELWSLLEAGELDAAQRQWFEAPGEERLFDLDSDLHELNDLAGDPQYQMTLERMRGALASWQERVDDWSEESEAEMLARFQPNGEVQVTAQPGLDFRDGRMHLSSNTDSASIGYRVDEGRWHLYIRPVVIPAGKLVEAKAVRYGWEESEAVEGIAP